MEDKLSSGMFAGEDLWAQLQWWHDQLIKTAKQVPDCSAATCANAIFGQSSSWPGNAALEVEQLRKKNEELAWYACSCCTHPCPLLILVFHH
jgi:hypothetical protein